MSQQQSPISSSSIILTAIENAVKKADSPEAKFISHDKVSDWLISWGEENEKEPPK